MRTQLLDMANTMALASSQKAIYRGAADLFLQPCRQEKLKPHHLSCRFSSESDSDPSGSGGDGARMAKLAVVTLAAGILALGPIGDAEAAKSGGRVGGQAFRSAAPRGSSPRINNSRTNIYINPPVAPPLIGGYGYGYGAPFFGGGWGWSPFTFFAPGPGVGVGIGGDFQFFVIFLVLSAVGAVIRRFTNRADDDDDY